LLATDYRGGSRRGQLALSEPPSARERRALEAERMLARAFEEGKRRGVRQAVELLAPDLLGELERLSD
jgi:hypothetical protein